MTVYKELENLLRTRELHHPLRFTLDIISVDYSNSYVKCQLRPMETKLWKGLFKCLGCEDYILRQLRA